MKPFGPSARADELSRLLDLGPVGAASVHSPALALAARLRAAGEASPEPRAEFRAALRTRLVAVAGVQAAAVEQPAAVAVRPAATSWVQGRRAQRGMGIAAGAMASVIAVTGVAVASSRSLPGDPFYGVKRQAERLQLQFAGNDLDRGTKHLEFAATRLQEVRGLTLGRRVLMLGPSGMSLAGGLAFGGSVDDRVRSTLEAMDSETQTGTALLTGAYRSTRSADPLRILTAFATKQSATLQTLLPELPVASRDEAQTSLSLVTKVGQQAGILLALGNCTLACNPQNTAPTLPTSAPAGPTPDPNATADAPCTCPPSEQPATEPTPTTEPQPSAAPSQTPTAQPSHTPTPRPTPAPSSSGDPLPLPTPPVPLPSLSVPVPIPTSPAPLPVPLPAAPTPGPTSAPLPLVPAVIALLPSLLPHA